MCVTSLLCCPRVDLWPFMLIFRAWATCGLTDLIVLISTITCLLQKKKAYECQLFYNNEIMFKRIVNLVHFEINPVYFAYSSSLQ